MRDVKLLSVQGHVCGLSYTGNGGKGDLDLERCTVRTYSSDRFNVLRAVMQGCKGARAIPRNIWAENELLLDEGTVTRLLGCLSYNTMRSPACA